MDTAIQGKDWKNDWKCEKCSYVNFSWRLACHKCKIEKSKITREYRTDNGVKNSTNVIPNNENQDRLSGKAKKTFEESRINEIKTLLRSLENLPQDLELRIRISLPVWLKCWKYYSQLSQRNLKVLITSFAMLPSLQVLKKLPPITLCQDAVKCYILNLKSCKNNSSDVLLKNVELVIELVEKLIDAEWAEEKATLISGLKGILEALIKVLDIREASHRKTLKLIADKMDELEKPWLLKVKEPLKVIGNPSSSRSEASSWQHVNVRWLSDVRFFQPAFLPVMKVPNTPSNGIYNDHKDYIDTVTSLWIGLTFYDGNSTLNPKCRQKEGGKECGEVMTPFNDKLLQCFKCKLDVTLKCPNQNHDFGLCSKCGDIEKVDLRGPPGQNASTNIYDCYVTHIDFNGRIFMTNVESRQPPKNPVNWRSTKRLNSGNLVGLIKISTPGSSLSETDQILWGEIVNHEHPFQEFRCREIKKLAVSLSSINQSSMCDYIQKGNYLAVIDCKTFVPEHIPVLKALEVQKVSKLPFQNGALLNISSKKDQSKYELYKDQLTNLIDTLYETDGEKSYDSLVNFIIEKSDLDPIVQICKFVEVPENHSKLLLINDLCVLLSESTLDLKQLRSFAEAIIEPVHLTHGPPGTGKSYLGVVIVRALLIIRNTWISCFPSVGEPPILVLSYKNHAIDELLCDLVKSDPNVSMIRIGDSKDPRLNLYTERIYQYSNSNAFKIKDEISKLNKQKLEYKDMQKKLSPLVDYDKYINCQPTNENEKTAKIKSASNAAMTLVSLIFKVKKLEEFLKIYEEEKFFYIDDVWDTILTDPSKVLGEISLSDIQMLWDGLKQKRKPQVSEVIFQWITSVTPSYQSEKQNCGLELKITLNLQDSSKKRHLSGRSVEISSPKRSRKMDVCDKTAERISSKRKVTIPTSSSNTYFQSNNDSNVISEKKFRFDNDTKEDEINEESEHLRHIQDVYDVEEGELLEFEEGYCSSAERLNQALSDILPTEKWSWEMSWDKRWYQCKLLEEKYCLLLSQLNELRNDEIQLLSKYFHEVNVEAKLRAYKGKAIIGGTIVGCIGRLEAIRSTKPFAILVEEASEVLEPLVFSCIVETTCKLEMIGDHLQLKPSVMSKFSFMRKNKINISMFERLIKAPKSHGVPFTVLSIQRRMRKNICDLTRGFYEDVVDHETCSTKKIGDALGSFNLGKRNGGNNFRDLMRRKSSYFVTEVLFKGNINQIVKLKKCTGEGREVPGVLPHLYFWNHEGNQTKARVGLSRVNEVEAEMVVALAQYLIYCGTPKSSIAIITPYKGQLMNIAGNLKKIGLLNDGLCDSVVISSVDRFQGDEADIVIISLVNDCRSQTGFVKEVNRMIVLLSRARIGMYILGNSSYFSENPNRSISHWTEIFKRLKEPGEIDTDQKAIKENINDIHYSGSRFGSKLPICCPLHRDSKMLVDSPLQFKESFCQKKCLKPLPCAHPCNLPCHFINIDDHNKQCKVSITQAPCKTHRKNLSCHELFQSVRIHERLSIDNAMEFYKCPELVNLQLPCMHNVQVECWSENKIVEGKKSYPECKQMAHNPFIYPKCRHELNVLCVKYNEYKKDVSKVKPCIKKVLYTPKCSHSVEVSCFLKEQYIGSITDFSCIKTLEILLPRCGHKANVSCEYAQILDQWSGLSCKSGIVYEGEDYGEIDYNCKEPVKLIRRCGHFVYMECSLAFEQASLLVPCHEEVNVTNPDCGHPATVLCYKAKILKDICSRDAVTVVLEGQTDLYFENPILHQKCTSEVLLSRKCGHEEKLKCYQARDDRMQPCQIYTDIVNPICGHSLSLPCHLSDLRDWKPWPGTKTYSEVLIHGVLNNDCSPPSYPPNPILQSCKEMIVIRGSEFCSHKMKCGAAFQKLGKSKKKCEERVSFISKCGHENTLECFSYSSYIKNPEKYSCTFPIEMTCWNCKNPVKKICSKRDERASCNKLTNWNCSNGHSFSKVPICEKGYPLKCPSCFLDEAKKYITSFKTSFNPEIVLPEELLSFKPTVTLNQSDKIYSFENFFKHQNVLISNLTKWFSQQSIIAQPIIQPKYIPCFMLCRETPLRFTLNKTLNCYKVCEWTLNNIKLLIEETKKGSRKVNLIFGVAFVCNTYVEHDGSTNGVEIFSKTEKQKGYDSLQSCQNKWEYLFIGMPYALLATHQFLLTHKNLISLYYKLSQKPHSNSLSRKLFHPEYTNFSIPELIINGIDGLCLLKNWDGFSLGRKEIINEHVCKELISKLQFCEFVFGSSSSQLRLFSGLNYLKSLSEKFKDPPEVFLLTSLEQISLGDFNTAQSSLDSYVKVVKEIKISVHPLFLLANSRLRLYQSHPNDAERWLKQFAELYPDAVNHWFDSKEKEMIKHDSHRFVPLHNCTSNNPLSKWSALKDKEHLTCIAMDKLMEMTGLKKVKEFAIDLFKFSLKFAKFSPEAKSANLRTLNFCFLGNAGSGKTTVARLLADILKDTGLRSAGTFVESSAQKLKDDGPCEFRKLAASAKNGILFIDEAYDLDPKGDSQGKPIVSELIVISENDREHLSIILAGYEDDMNEKLFSFNEGIKSRFEMVYFEDFDEGELKTIWNGEVEKRKFVCDDSVSTVAAKRLAKMSGRKGFGNARAVRKEVEKAIQAAMAEEDFDESKMTLSIEDVVGESPLDNPKLKAILKEFDEKVGWQIIKASVNELIEICKKNFTLQLMGKKTLPVMLNRLFLGNPGTGKTTCAKLYGRLLKELNFLSIGDVVISAASDFVGSHIGESPKKTNAMLEKARGKVLVIDEAYSLNDQHYGKEVLDVLVEKVQNTENDDIAVLLLGYEPQMREMLRDQNPGLARRFAIDYAFVFEDYTESELFSILKSVCKKENIQLSSEVSEVVLKLLEKQRAQANFGNAGAIDNVIRAALAKASSRPLTSEGMIKLLPSDISAGEVERGSDPFAPLEKLYQVETIRQQLIEIRNVFKVAQAEGSKDSPDLGHFVFQGAPGTGKTTVARVMADILFDLELLPRKHVEETSGLGLTGEFVGQTKSRVKEKLDAARGGILFIDEAYELGKGHYGEEAITTLVAAMTDPNYKLVIIIAGYPKDMDQMLSWNVGLKSRFKRFINFEDWDSSNCIEFLQKKAQADNYNFDSDVKDCFYQGLEELRSYPGWGNARDVVALWQKVLEQRANRVVQEPESKKRICKSDALMALNNMIKERKPKIGKEELNERLQSELNKFQQVQYEPDVTPAAQKISKENVFEGVEKSKDIKKKNYSPKQDQVETEDVSDDTRDPGVPDEIWRQLQLAKLAAKEEEQKKELKKQEEKRLQEEKDNLLNELLRELQEEREEEKRQQMLLELKRKQEEERKRREAEEERLREEQRKNQDTQNAIRKICLCPAGYFWYKQGGGWRCGGGSHFVSDEELQRQFTFST